MPEIPKLFESRQATSDVQVTSLAIDAYARLVCNTLDEAWKASHGIFDVVVIGSGMFGGYTATKLSRLSGNRKPKVLILEAGHFLYPEHVDNLPRLAKDELAFELGGVRGFPFLEKKRSLAQRERYAKNERHHYCVGGKSIAWGKWAPQMLDSDLSRWPEQVVNFLKSEQGYKMLELETGVTGDAPLIRGVLHEKLIARAKLASESFEHLRDPSYWPAYQPPIATQAGSPTSGIFSFDAYSSLAGLLDAIREDADQAEGDIQKRNLFLVPRCRVHRLEHNAGRVTGIHALVGDSMESRFLPLAHRSRVVLALNSMESTRLALGSALPEPPTGPLMGRNLVAHLRSGFTVRMKRSALPDLASSNEPLATSALHIQGDDGQRRFHFQIFSAADHDYNSFRMIYKMMPDVESMQALRDRQTSGYITMHVLTVGEMLNNPAIPIGDGNVSSARLANPEDDPAYEDIFGEIKVRKILADWHLSTEENEFWTNMDKAAYEFVKKIAGEGNGFEIRHRDGSWRSYPPDFASPNEGYRDELSSTFHEAGTLWMGEDPQLSVTNVDGRFHRVKNLYCVDQAVFPTAGSANPVLTGLCISRMVVEGILKELGMRKPVQTKTFSSRVDHNEKTEYEPPPWDR